MRSVRRLVRGAAVLLGLLLLAGCRQGGPRSITTAELSEHAGYLASDDLAGRYLGSSEIATAEDYIAQAFREAGLEPLPGASDYFMPFTAWRQGFATEATALSVYFPDAPLATATLGTDFRPFDFSTPGSVTADLVFAGYGITAPEYGYDDYAGMDVRGKLVLILRYEPNENDASSPFAGSHHTSHAYFATKTKNAQAHGAVGMLLFTTPLAHPQEEDLRVAAAYRLHPEELEVDAAETTADQFIALHVSQGYAELLARAAGTTIRDLQTAVDAGTRPADIEIGGLRVSATVSRSGPPEPVQARNVVGYLLGRQAGAMVVVGAHHDHIGSFAPPAGATTTDTIYNGADDNASGVAGVLELAEAFGGLGRRPERGIIFTTFSGEEEYLLGSDAFLESGLVDPSSISFMLNLDMIGRNPDGVLEVYGSSSGPDLREAVERLNADVGLRLSFPVALSSGMDSDQSMFAARGIPSLFLHTGLHDDFHGLDDEPDRLSYDHMLRVLDLAYRIVDDRSGLSGPR